LATSKSWRDKDSGERKDRTEWHSIVSYSDNSNKFAMQYLKKGSKVYIEGELQTRKYDDKEGVTRYRTEIILEAFGSKLISVEAIKSDNKPAGQERTDLDDEIQF
jgi:single-strand DNA-binding protein